MRGAGAVLANPFPMGTRLPGLYQDDDFIQRFIVGVRRGAGAGVGRPRQPWPPTSTRPWRPPTSSSGWRAGSACRSTRTGRWNGGGTWWPGPPPLYRRRGTAGALAEQVALYAGVVPEVVETGGVAWSAEPGGPLPGAAEARLTVRVVVPDPSAVDVRRLEAIVAEAKPAHIPATVEVTAG